MRMRLFFILGLMAVLTVPASFATLTQSWRIDSTVGGPVYQDNTNRGMGYNPVTDHVLLVRTTGPTVTVYNNAGTSLGTMNTTGLTVGTFGLNKVRAVDRGASGWRVYGCNTVSDNKVTSFVISRWSGAGAGSSEIAAGAPTIIYRNRAADAGTAEASPIGPTMPNAGANTYRIGDTMGVIYDSGTDTTSLFFTISTGEAQKRVYRFDIAEATGTVTITNIPLTGATGGTGYGVAPTAVGGNFFCFMGERARYDSTGGNQQVTSAPGGGATCVHPTYATIGGINYLGYVDGANSLLASSAFRRFAISRVTDVGGKALLSQYEIGPGLTGAASIANGNGTGDVQFDATNGRVYALVSNNYLGRWDISTPAVSSVTWDGGGAADNWDDPLNWNPDGVPGSNNDVVLDNTNVAGSYTVQISSISETARCRTVQVGYAGNANTIGLQVTATAGPGIALNVAGQLASPDATADFVLEQGGRFENLSATSAGNVVNNLNTNNTASIRSGSHFLHNSARAFSGVFPTSGNGAATFASGSTLEMGQASGTTTTLSGRTYGNFILSATAAKTYTASGSGAVAILNDLTIGTNVTFNPSMTGGFSIAGNIINNGSGGALSNTLGGIVLNGTAQSITGASTLTFPTGLTLNNTSLTLTSGNLTIAPTQVLALNAAVLNTGAGQVNVGEPAGSITRTTGFVNGNLSRTIANTTTGVRSFPIGTAGEYSPVDVNFTVASGTAGSLLASATATDQANVVDANATLDRFWTLTPTTLAGFTADLTFGWDAADVTGAVNEGAMLAGAWSGTAWAIYPASINTGAHTGTVTGVTGFSAWTFGNSGAVPAELSVFSAN